MKAKAMIYVLPESRYTKINLYIWSYLFIFEILNKKIKKNIDICHLPYNNVMSWGS